MPHDMNFETCTKRKQFSIYTVKQLLFMGSKTNFLQKTLLVLIYRIKHYLIRTSIAKNISNVIELETLRFILKPLSILFK